MRHSSNLIIVCRWCLETSIVDPSKTIIISFPLVCLGRQFFVKYGFDLDSEVQFALASLSEGSKKVLI